MSITGPLNALIAQPLVEQIQRHLFFSQAKAPSLATQHDHYMALSLAVRDRLLQNWVDTAETYTRQGGAHGRLPVGGVSARPSPG